MGDAGGAARQGALGRVRGHPRHDGHGDGQGVDQQRRAPRAARGHARRQGGGGVQQVQEEAARQPQVEHLLPQPQQRRPGAPRRRGHAILVDPGGGVRRQREPRGHLAVQAHLRRLVQLRRALAAAHGRKRRGGAARHDQLRRREPAQHAHARAEQAAALADRPRPDASHGDQPVQAHQVGLGRAQDVQDLQRRDGDAPWPSALRQHQEGHAARVRGEAVGARSQVGRPPPARSEHRLQPQALHGAAARPPGRQRLAGGDDRRAQRADQHPPGAERPQPVLRRGRLLLAARLGARQGRHVDPARPEHHEHLQGTLPAAAARQRRAGRLPAPGLLGAAEGQEPGAAARAAARAHDVRAEPRPRHVALPQDGGDARPGAGPYDPRGAGHGHPRRRLARQVGLRGGADGVPRLRQEERREAGRHVGGLAPAGAHGHLAGAGKLRLHDCRGEQEAPRRDQRAALHESRV